MNHRKKVFENVVCPQYTTNTTDRNIETGENFIILGSSTDLTDLKFDAFSPTNVR